MLPLQYFYFSTPFIHLQLQSIPLEHRQITIRLSTNPRLDARVSKLEGRQRSWSERVSDAEAQSSRIRSIVKRMSNRNLSSKELYAMAAEEAFADRDGECPICFECPLDDPLQTPCRHLFCRECILDILQQKSQCPMCRSTVNPKDLKKPRNDGVDGEELNENKDSVEDKGNDDNDDVIRFDAKINRLMALRHSASHWIGSAVNWDAMDFQSTFLD